MRRPMLQFPIHTLQSCPRVQYAKLYKLPQHYKGNLPCSAEGHLQSSIVYMVFVYCLCLYCVCLLYVCDNPNVYFSIIAIYLPNEIK